MKISYILKGAVMFRKKQEQQPPRVAANGMEDLNAREDALFEALDQSKKAKKRKLIRTVVVVVAVPVSYTHLTLPTMAVV